MSRATRRLLDHWSSEQLDERPFFCQLEAAETVIWLMEAGPRLGGAAYEEIGKRLSTIHASRNDAIPRLAIKMATGTGKTKTMAMVIAWWALREESDADVLLIAPNLTVRERLQELDPETEAGRRAYRDLLPPPLRGRFRARVSVLNFQAFQRRSTLFVDGEKDAASGIAKKMLRRGRSPDTRPDEAWTESPRAMLNRLLRKHRGHRRLLVLNDEGHHCYRPSASLRQASGEEREYEQSAALWFRALEALRDAGTLAQVLDFSATPMFLRLPPDAESPLFPWIVSDYPLIEAVEAGLTKIPQVPVDDDIGDRNPVYRNLYQNTPASERKLRAGDLPQTVEAPLGKLYEHYERTNERYQASGRIPVFIVVANTVQNATELYRHIAGYQAEAVGEGPPPTPFEPGRCALFSNVLPDGSGWVEQPPTILVHSKLDAPDEMRRSLAQVMEAQAKLLAPDAKTKGERLARIREIANTVGKEGRPGARIRCVVSVSMLSEGWDTRTVTHILGFRKFGSELLCEQVAGRSLRRTSYEDFADEDRRLLRPETSHLFGVPFSFMRARDEAPRPPREPYKVCSVTGREEFGIRFPQVAGYRWELPGRRLRLEPDRVRPFDLREGDPEDATAPGDTLGGIPEFVHSEGVVGGGSVFEDRRRERHFQWRVARDVLRDIEGGLHPAGSDLPVRRRTLFGDAAQAAQEWLAHPDVRCGSFGEVVRREQAPRVAREIVSACSLGDDETPRILPIFADEEDPAADRVLDTGSVHYWTAKRRVREARRSELNRAPCDSDPELSVAEALDSSAGVECWVRNDRLHWSIPYLDARTGLTRSYLPDFVARLRERDREGRPVHLVIEYKGLPGPNSEAKERAVRDSWIPALRNTDDPECQGEWRYCVLTRPASVATDLEAAIHGGRTH